jgi:hypothetical protein
MGQPPEQAIFYKINIIEMMSKSTKKIIVELCCEDDPVKIHTEGYFDEDKS